MRHIIEIRPLATLEVLDAYDWYESQQEGLGLRFLETLEDFYNGLLSNPKTHSYYHNSVRQGVLSKFPYTVVYEIFDNSIVVYSVFMQKQDPLKKRIKYLNKKYALSSPPSTTHQPLLFQTKY